MSVVVSCLILLSLVKIIQSLPKLEIVHGISWNKLRHVTVTCL